MHLPVRHAPRHLVVSALLAISLAIGLALGPVFGHPLWPAPAAFADGIVLPPPGCFAPPVPVTQESPPAPVTRESPAVAPQVAPPGVRLPVQPPVVVEPVRPIVPCWLTVRYHRVQVEIAGQVATTRVDQVFVNETGRDLEGTYVFPLPDDAAVTGFSMWVDGVRTEGQVLTREEARRLYESIVRRNRDPALLEYAGRGAFQARVFPVPAGGERRLQLEYSQVLPAAGGLVRYVYPLNTERFSPRPLQQASVSLTIRSPLPLKNVYSPSHEIVVTRPGDAEATVSWEASNVTPRRDFELVYGLSPDPVGLHLVTHRPPGEDGYFLLLAAPAPARQDGSTRRAVAQDVSLVFDTSGSMAGEKMEQARGALRYVVNHLNPEDRFNIVAFSSTTSSFATSMQPVTARESALAFVDGLTATGGTNIGDALATALRGGTGDRPHTVVFVTDGLPTVGAVDVETIVAGARTAAGTSGGTGQLRVFPFGVGFDVNTTLLDGLASEFGGTSAYVKPGENLESAVSRFYAAVGTPVLADLRLDFGGAEVYDLVPPRLPDLYAGGQVIVAGRYRRSGTFDVALSGTAAGSTERYSAPGVTFAAGPAVGAETLPRLWAGRKIGFLLAEVRRRGANPELIDEIVALARRYGIATPYTSFFVPEPGQAPQAAADALRRGVAAAPTSGAAAVQRSEATNQLQQGNAAPPAPAERVRVAGAKTFVLTGEVWQDVTGGVEPPADRIAFAFASDEYFAFLDAHPDAAPYLAVGPRLIVQLGTTWYEVTA